MENGLLMKTHLTKELSMHKLYETVKVKNWWQVKALEWESESIASRKVVATAYDKNTAEAIERMLEEKAVQSPINRKRSLLSKIFYW